MEWISVKDNVPQQTQNVLLCMGGVVGIGGYSPDFGWWGTGADFDDEARVTHWMPLPAPPSNADHIGSIDPESENRAYDDLRSAYDRAKGGA